MDLLLVHNPTVSKEEYSSACLPHFFELFNKAGSPQAIKPETLPDGTSMRTLVLDAKLRIARETADKEAAREARKRTWKVSLRGLHIPLVSIQWKSQDHFFSVSCNC